VGAVTGAGLTCTALISARVVLDDHEILDELNDTLQSAWARWAFDLWGVTDGQADVDDNCTRTRRWFIDTAGAL
jgi:hypothetical protein